MFTEKANKIFAEVIATYHVLDDVYQPFQNKYDSASDIIAHLLYQKCWIDTVQWHYEDLIREPFMRASEAVEIKRKIDQSNQDRTDIVEYIDSYFLAQYKAVIPKENATINTESPAWAVDRLSILALKVYHMREKANDAKHTIPERQVFQEKLEVLLEQQVDLSTAIDQLLTDIAQGNKYMKVYKQMKMYKHQN